MSVMTYATQEVRQRRRSVVTTATLIVLFWALAATLVVLVHREIEPVSPLAGMAVKACVLLLTSLAYVRLVAPESTVHHALLVGLVWLVLAIAAEVILTAISGHNWFALIGSPVRPLLRDVLLVSWIASPALFARRSA